jgi:hypothetical protein
MQDIVVVAGDDTGWSVEELSSRALLLLNSRELDKL